jgi:hypothetical protein
MKMLKFFASYCLLLAATLAYGQKWDEAPPWIIFLGKTYNKATLTYENGATKNGFVAIPKTCGQKEISFKTDKNAHVEEIPSEMLKVITVHNKDSSVYIFERINYVVNPGDKPKKKEWLFVMEKGYATLYLRIDKYKIDNEGILIFIAEEGLPMNFVRKKNETVGVLVATTNPYIGAGVMIGSNRPFKKNAPVVFAEDKELVSQIKAGNYSSEDIVEVVKAYNKFMSEK